jgi:hypothetical protein
MKVDYCTVTEKTFRRGFLGVKDSTRDGHPSKISFHYTHSFTGFKNTYAVEADATQEHMASRVCEAIQIHIMSIYISKF